MPSMASLKQTVRYHRCKGSCTTPALPVSKKQLRYNNEDDDFPLNVRFFLGLIFVPFHDIMGAFDEISPFISAKL
jgi:hypothetical protein